MICNRCGANFPDGYEICPQCGAHVHQQPQQNQGYYQPPQQPYQPYQQTYYSAVENPYKIIEDCKTLGIVAIIGCFFINLIGIICGAIGLSKLKSVPDSPELAEKKRSAKTLCKWGVGVAVAKIVVAVITAILSFLFSAGLFFSQFAIDDFFEGLNIIINML